MLSLRTNAASLGAQRNTAATTQSLNNSLARLSSGYRITRASDDAAGLGVSTNLTAQVRSYNQAARNASDGMSVVQTAEASLDEVSNILTRMRELAMQASSDGIGSTERSYITQEKDQLVAELDRINTTTEFNGQPLFGGGVLEFQGGIRGTPQDFLNLDTGAIRVDSGTLGVAGVDLQTSAATARNELQRIDASIELVSQYRSQLGAIGNRLSSVSNTIAQAAESATASNSRIRDVDVAEETSVLSRNQVLMQAGISVLAQANQAPEIALKLLQ